MATFKITVPCWLCGRTGKIVVGYPDASETDCPECGGTGQRHMCSDIEGLDAAFNSVHDKLNDILDKCNDIFEKVNE